MWEIFTEITSQARIGGMGGIFGFDFQALPVVFALHQVPEEDWFCYYTKLMRTWEAAAKHWNKTDDTNKPKK